MDSSYAGATYNNAGGYGGDVARIAVMGTYRGVNPGSIQAAIWNLLTGSSAGGEDCQPGYSGYDDSG